MKGSDALLFCSRLQTARASGDEPEQLLVLMFLDRTSAIRHYANTYANLGGRV
jgi:hypothetical protein